MFKAPECSSALSATICCGRRPQPVIPRPAGPRCAHWRMQVGSGLTKGLLGVRLQACRGHGSESGLGWATSVLTPSPAWARASSPGVLVHLWSPRPVSREGALRVHQPGLNSLIPECQMPINRMYLIPNANLPYIGFLFLFFFSSLFIYFLF